MGKSRPTKQKIVEYWSQFFIDSDAEGNLEVFDFYPHTIWHDWGEPDCWACGRYDPQYPDIGVFEEDPSKHSWATVLKMWGRAALHRHHILPVVLGGSNDPSNFVLLCRRCHRDTPHTSNSDIFWAWMRNRPSEILQIVSSVARMCCDSFNISVEEFSGVLVEYMCDPTLKEQVDQRIHANWADNTDGGLSLNPWLCQLFTETLSLHLEHEADKASVLNLLSYVQSKIPIQPIQRGPDDR